MNEEEIKYCDYCDSEHGERCEALKAMQIAKYFRLVVKQGKRYSLYIHETFQNGIEPVEISFPCNRKLIKYISEIPNFRKILIARLINHHCDAYTDIQRHMRIMAGPEYQ